MDGPWYCIGGFNAVLHATEKQSRCPPSQKQIDEFRAALDACSLADLGFIGNPLTWNNRRPGEANTRERLDRAVANLGWRQKYPATTMTHLYSHASDHRPLIMHVRTDWRQRTRPHRNFKFEEMWLMWDYCEQAVRDAWDKGGEGGSGQASTKS